MAIATPHSELQYAFWLSLSEARALQAILASARPSLAILSSVTEQLNGLLASQVSECSATTNTETTCNPELEDARIPISSSDGLQAVENAGQVNSESLYTAMYFGVLPPCDRAVPLAVQAPSQVSKPLVKRKTRPKRKDKTGCGKKASGRRADQSFSAATPDTQKGSVSVRKWAHQARHASSKHPSLPAFVARLEAEVSASWCHVSPLCKTLSLSHISAGFEDDSLSSILARCKAMNEKGMAVSFLTMIQHVQLLCKCTW